MSRAAIVAPVRTAVGRFGGTLRPVPAEDLAATVIRAVVARSGIDPERIEDVVMAQSYANSEAPCIGRWAALQAGLPIAVPGLQIDRRCGGGLQAVATAAMMVQTGAADAVLAGGRGSRPCSKPRERRGRDRRRLGLPGGAMRAEGPYFDELTAGQTFPAVPGVTLTEGLAARTRPSWATGRRPGAAALPGLLRPGASGARLAVRGRPGLTLRRGVASAPFGPSAVGPALVPGPLALRPPAFLALWPLALRPRPTPAPGRRSLWPPAAGPSGPGERSAGQTAGADGCYGLQAPGAISFGTYDFCRVS
jgi:Thiolase, N-terminal domain